MKPIAATETAIVNPRSAHAHLKKDSKHTSMFIFMFAHAEGSDEEGIREWSVRKSKSGE
jgi:hypothetical protein